MPAVLPAEAELHALAERFAQAEARVRTLIAQAPTGDRRELLRQALLVLGDLRRPAAQAGDNLTLAYFISAHASAVLAGRPDLPAPDRVRDLAGSLARHLDNAVRTAQDAARGAFRAVDRENVPDMAHAAVTALVDAAGRRRTLGPHAHQLTRTLGRRAVSRGTRHALAPDGQVTIHGSREDPLCARHAGRTVPASAGLPPYHVGCKCTATPAGHTPTQLAQAMEDQRKQVYKDWYAARHARQLATA